MVPFLLLCKQDSNVLVNFLIKTQQDVASGGILYVALILTVSRPYYYILHTVSVDGVVFLSNNN